MAPADSPPPAPSAASRDVPLLVVDDNPDAADMLARLLEVLGFASRVSYHPAQALGLVRDWQPSVAIVDIGLPGMDGYELARRLRAVPGRESLKVVALSGHGEPADLARSRAAGIDAHFVKPVAPDALLQTLRTLLQTT